MKGVVKSRVPRVTYCHGIHAACQCKQRDGVCVLHERSVGMSRCHGRGDLIDKRHPKSDGVTVSCRSGAVQPPGLSSTAGPSAFATSHISAAVTRRASWARAADTRHQSLTMQRTKVRRRVLACARCRKRKLSVRLRPNSIMAPSRTDYTI